MPTRRRSSRSAVEEGKQEANVDSKRRRHRGPAAGSEDDANVESTPTAYTHKDADGSRIIPSLSQHQTVARLGDLFQSPALKKKTDKDHQALPERAATTTTLGQFVAPLSEQKFLATCFRQMAVHVPASVSGTIGEARLRFLEQELFDLDPESILSSTASENIFVWLRQRRDNPQPASSTPAPAGSTKDPPTRPAKDPHDLIHSIEVSDPTTALALHRAGHATYCRAPPTLERHLVSSLMAGTGLGCGQYDPTAESTTCLGRGEVEIFLGTTGHCTNWHWDFQENFTVQLSGTKRWTLKRGSVSHPLRGCTPHYRSPESVEPQIKAARLADPYFEFGYPDGNDNDDGATEEVTLHPGDVFYFPAGMWHKVEVLEPGVSLNVSLMATNYASVTCQALQHLLLQREDWRECVVNNSVTSAVTTLKKLLHDLPSIIEEFEKKGGADAVFPPVLRCPSESARPRNGVHEEESDDDDDGEDVDGDEGAGDVIDVTRQQNQPLPYDCTERQLRDQLATHDIVRNPLALLIRERDIIKYYKRGDDTDEVEDDSQEVYVLNVNYAGNESHESVVRARILGTGTLLPSLYESTRDLHRRDILPDPATWIRSESERRMFGCMAYHGFLVWVPRESTASGG